MAHSSGILNWLNKPYPFFYNAQRNFLIAAGCGIFIWLIQMAVTDAAWCHRYLVLGHDQVAAVFGLITFGCVLFTFGVVPKVVLGESRLENWSIKMELGLIALLLIIIAISNFAFVVLASKNMVESFTLPVFLSMLLSTLIFGFFPSTVMVWISYTINLRENLKHARLHNSQLELALARNGVESQEQRVSIPSEIQSEMINIDVNQLLFIRSDGNYVEVHQKDEEQGVSVKVFRCSMTWLEQELVGFERLLRTHRSYIVNLRNIARTEGNARNYQLHFNGSDQVVPVSRNRFSEFNRALMETNGDGAQVHSSQVLPVRPKLVPVRNNGAVSG